MAKAEIKKTPIVIFEFHQEKEDKDYGSCLWARFLFDLENYDMHITSDCGNYGYGWIPTPEHESFLKLMSGINSDYLLDKIASRETIDNDKTYGNIKFLLEQCADENLEDINIDLEELESACNQNTDRDIVDSVCHIIKFTSLDEHIEEYELYESIEKDYSASQKKIAEVFENYIQPKITELLKKAGEAK